MYLRLFKKGNPSRFAVIKVGGKSLTDSLPSFRRSRVPHQSRPVPSSFTAAGRRSTKSWRSVGSSSREGRPPHHFARGDDVIREVLEDANRKLVEGDPPAGRRRPRGSAIAVRAPGTRTATSGSSASHRHRPQADLPRHPHGPHPRRQPRRLRRGGQPSTSTPTSSPAASSRPFTQKFILLTEEAAFATPKTRSSLSSTSPATSRACRTAAKSPRNGAPSCARSRQLLEELPDDDVRDHHEPAQPDQGAVHGEGIGHVHQSWGRRSRSTRRGRGSTGTGCGR